MIAALNVTLGIVKELCEAAAAFRTELSTVKRVSKQLIIVSRTVEPLYGQRLNNDAAAEAVKQLQQDLAQWQPALEAYLNKPITGWRPFAKGLARFFRKVPKMKDLMNDIRGGLEGVKQGLAIEMAIVQPVISVHRDLPKPHIEPYALNMLKELLSKASSSTDPPKVVVLRGEKGTGKSIMSILVARDLELLEREAAGGWVQQLAVGPVQTCVQLSDSATCHMHTQLDRRIRVCIIILRSLTLRAWPVNVECHSQLSQSLCNGGDLTCRAQHHCHSVTVTEPRPHDRHLHAVCAMHTPHTYISVLAAKHPGVKTSADTGKKLFDGGVYLYPLSSVQRLQSVQDVTTTPAAVAGALPWVPAAAC